MNKNNDWLDQAIAREINLAANKIPVPDKKLAWKRIEKELIKNEKQRAKKRIMIKYISVAALVLLLISSLIIVTPDEASADFWLFKTIKNFFQDTTTISGQATQKDLPSGYNDNGKSDTKTELNTSRVKQLIPLSEATLMLGYFIALPESVPDRYTLSGAFIDNPNQQMSAVEIHYLTGDENVSFIITQIPISPETGFSYNFRTNNAETKNIIINGEEATLLIFQDRTQLLWQQQTMYYIITGPLSEDEIVSIAKSLK